ncbi:hypothetical protein KOW79_013932 [Hemibagrus wyckioides]|uniref:Uncharacterized protein n=1 Tax=Hemibagrus wyckioides TaxID=337641 RepID=A0A9D3NFL3_9TELE|nr:hypothetical protein KOW79_013932 [Hemibagrus wyckioides]
MDSISQQLHQGVQSFRWEKANELWGPYNEEADDTCCANTYCAASASALGTRHNSKNRRHVTVKYDSCCSLTRCQLRKFISRLPEDFHGMTPLGHSYLCLKLN